MVSPGRCWQPNILATRKEAFLKEKDIMDDNVTNLTQQGSYTKWMLQCYTCLGDIRGDAQMSNFHVSNRGGHFVIIAMAQGKAFNFFLQKPLSFIFHSPNWWPIPNSKSKGYLREQTLAVKLTKLWRPKIFQECLLCCDMQGCHKLIPGSLQFSLPTHEHE